MAGWRCLTSPTPKRSPAMTEVQGKPSIVAAKALLKGDPEGLRELVRAVLQEALEAEMSDALGAAKRAHHGPARLPIGLLRPHARHACWQAGAAGAAGPGGAAFHPAVRTLPAFPAGPP